VSVPDTLNLFEPCASNTFLIFMVKKQYHHDRARNEPINKSPYKEKGRGAGTERIGFVRTTYFYYIIRNT
jgi:hypothetical protein